MEATRDGYTERNKSGVQRQTLQVFSHLKALQFSLLHKTVDVCIQVMEAKEDEVDEDGGGRKAGVKRGRRVDTVKVHHIHEVVCLT